MKNELMICLDETKFKQVLYEDHINKYMKLNEKNPLISSRCKTNENLAIKDLF